MVFCAIWGTVSLSFPVTYPDFVNFNAAGNVNRTDIALALAVTHRILEKLQVCEGNFNVGFHCLDNYILRPKDGMVFLSKNFSIQTFLCLELQEIKEVFVTIPR